MRIEPLGDLAWIVRDLAAPAAQTARAIEAAKLPGVTDVVPCAETVGVYSISPLDPDRILSACGTASAVVAAFRTHTIPVCYDLGEDLEVVAGRLGMRPAELIEAHASATYTCFAVGFCPGFAYLGPLPEPLRGVPRLPSPRTRTAPGSLGMTGNQTAVYPLARPGGWPIIGRTPLTLVDVGADYFPIVVGDTIRFEPIDRLMYETLQGGRL